MKIRLRKPYLYLTVLFASLILYSTLIETNLILVKQQVIYDEGLANVFGGKVVIQISDLHVRRVGFRERKLVSMINALNPDLIFITGEYLGKRLFNREDYSPQIKAVSSVLGQMRARYGMWGITGEDDLYPREKLEEMLDSLEQKGVNILVNKNDALAVDGKKINLIGVSTETKGMREAFSEAAVIGPTILLSHFPAICNQVADALAVNLAESEETGGVGWGWQDNAYWTVESGEIYFAEDGIHTMRVQRREDGVSIDQILLRSSDNIPFGDNNGTEKSELRLEAGDILITADQIADADIQGAWRKTEEPTAYGNVSIFDGPDRGNKVSLPLADPKHYFDIKFRAEASTRYHLWIRLKAYKDRIASDSVFVQFSDSLDSSGNDIFRIGKPLKPAQKINLILAGDTHGGQVRVPFYGPLLNLFRNYGPLLNMFGKSMEFDSGLFNIDGTQMYVNRGIGWTSLPIRFNCPPEITVFEFR